MLQKELTKRDKPASASEVGGKKQALLAKNSIIQLSSLSSLLSLEKEDTHFLVTHRAGTWPVSLRSRCKNELLGENISVE